MPKSAVLDQVAAELADGRTQPAIQRLGSLVATYPTDLELRQQLSTAYHRIGDLIQAGRWGYLCPDTDPRALAAFERAYPDPGPRLRRLGWPRDRHGPTDLSRQRLAALVGTQPGPWRPNRPPRPGRYLLVRRLIPVAGATLGLALIGLITVVQWIVR